jgi:ketosteroid isomerase-like protein
MTDSTPDVVIRYLAAADAKDPKAVADCFADDGTVLDEGVTYTGHDEIVGWREQTLSKWTYTTTVTGTEPLSADRYRVRVHLSGDFPGGEADLAFDFTISEGLITALRIVE